MRAIPTRVFDVPWSVYVSVSVLVTTTRALVPVNKPKTTAIVIIARWPHFIPHLAVLRTADDTSLAVADDLVRCDWLGRLG